MPSTKTRSEQVLAGSCWRTPLAAICAVVATNTALAWDNHNPDDVLVHYLTEASRVVIADISEQSAADVDGRSFVVYSGTVVSAIKGDLGVGASVTFADRGALNEIATNATRPTVPGRYLLLLVQCPEEPFELSVSSGALVPMEGEARGPRIFTTPTSPDSVYAKVVRAVGHESVSNVSASSDAVVRGTVLSVESASDVPNIPYENRTVTLQVNSTLRQPVGAAISPDTTLGFRLPRTLGTAAEEGWGAYVVSPGDEIIAFLMREENGWRVHIRPYAIWTIVGNQARVVLEVRQCFDQATIVSQNSVSAVLGLIAP